jgi:hypothetical protein
MSIPISELKGKVFREVRGMRTGSDEIVFVTDTDTYRMYHSQSCCESVDLDDVVGDPEDLVGTPILVAYEQNSNGVPPKEEGSDPDEYQWTFYRLATIKGTVTLRWYGTSNGCYSMGVSIVVAPSGPQEE